MKSSQLNLLAYKGISGVILPVLFFGVFLFSCADNPVTEEEPPEVQFGTAGPFTHTIVAEGLTLPWQIAPLPDGRLLITERGGLVRVVENGELQEEPWLDLRDSLRTPYGETVSRSGLLGIAADPDFETNGRIFLGYSYHAPYPNTDFNRIITVRENSASGRVTPEEIIFDGVKGATMHNTGQLKFGPDGKLYWSAGDRHVIESAQDRDDLSGTILRINADGTVPSDNPFDGSPVWAYGLRNSQGFDWHPGSGSMFATEHGPSGGTGRACCLDEVNRIEPGKNYGWPRIVGDEKRNGMEQPLIHSGTGFPVADYTWAPSGATFVSEGPWEGTFLFAGLRSESLWQLKLDDKERPIELNRMLDGTYGRLRSVEQAPDGYLYVITSNKDHFGNRQGTSYESDMLIRIEPGAYP